MSKLEGKVALVTGASGHLGNAICVALEAAGATVVGTHKDNEKKAPGRSLRADLASGSAGQELLSRMRQDAGPPDILVCAHGGTLRRGVFESGRAGNDEPMWTVNTHATIRLAALAAKGMLRKRNGRIILIGSRAGSAGMPGQAEYAATKGALSAWAASAAWEFGPFGITVNVVAPGAIEPDARSEAAVYSDEENELVASRTAVRRLGTAREVAAVVAFLAGPAAGFVTGQTIAVDGGARW
jgi:3-oxoacyl-[acyl-carrier protein] reductase